MTNQTLIVGLVVGFLVAAATGWIGSRFKKPKLNAAIASALAFSMALPILLDYWQVPQRLFAPRAAVEWLPLGLMAFTVIACLATIDDGSRKWIWLSLGVVAAIALAGRAMYGSIYFRWGNHEWRSVAAIVVWGGLIGVTWLQQVTAAEPTRKIDGLLQWLALIAVSVNLAMSGSFSYGGIGFLLAAAAIGSWLSSGSPSPLVAAASLLLLGLGPTFAEMQWRVALLFGVAIVTLSSMVLLNSNKRRWSCIGIAMMCMLVGSALTISKLRQDMSSQSKEATGYEAYR